MKVETSNRIFGLDIMRSLAVIIVVLMHGDCLINKYFNTSIIYFLPDGVDLFFVLSGFLIGCIIIKEIDGNKKPIQKIILGFLIRRWFRTLPNYYLFLVLNIALIYFGLIKGVINKYLITYFFFFQNFQKPYDFLFWESWSLSVEEWFYLAFPFIVLLVFKISGFNISVKRGIFFSILLFLILPLSHRIIYANSELDFDLFFRKLVVTRLDTIGFGLLGAFTYFYYFTYWRKFQNISFVLGILLLLVLQWMDYSNHIYFHRTFYYSFVGISILLFLPKLESFKSENIPYKPVAFVSKISYSIYLIHVPLLQILSKFFTTTNKYQVAILYSIYWLLTILLSCVVYRFYEKPMMDIRDRIGLAGIGK